jgi:hypothetical protein
MVTACPNVTGFGELTIEIVVDVAASAPMGSMATRSVVAKTAETENASLFRLELRRICPLIDQVEPAGIITLFANKRTGGY